MGNCKIGDLIGKTRKLLPFSTMESRRIWWDVCSSSIFWQIELYRINLILRFAAIQIIMWCCFEFGCNVLFAQSHILQSTASLSDVGVFFTEVASPFVKALMCLFLILFGIASNLSHSLRFSFLQMIGIGYGVHSVPEFNSRSCC